MSADSVNVLMARAQDGSSAALDELLAQVRQAILRYARAQRLIAEDAEDLAQEVCLAVLTIVPSWQERDRSLWGFVFTVARNKITDRVRQQSKSAALRLRLASGEPRELDQAADSSVGPEDAVLASEGSRRMAELLGDLPRTQREVLILRVVVGLTGQETADTLNLAVGSVHVLQHRAVKRLRETLAPAREAHR